MKVTYVNQTFDLKDLMDRHPEHEFVFIDSGTYRGLKEARSVKNHWGARKEPFCLIEEGGEAIKAFYVEGGDVIGQVTKYLDDEKDL